MNRKIIVLSMLCNFLWLSLLAINGLAQEVLESPTKPVPIDFEWWRERNQSFQDRAAQGNVDLIFIGDSITQGWEGDGKTVWKKYYAPRNALNMGINGDRTQNVLWRLENSNWSRIKPKLAVIMLGTNNTHPQYSNDEIASGIEAVVKKLREKLPETKVLLLAIFPRNRPMAGCEKIAKINERIAKLADNKTIYYLDIGSELLVNGKVSREVMPDLLHLSRKGYQIWAESIEPKVAELMDEKSDH